MNTNYSSDNSQTAGEILAHAKYAAQSSIAVEIGILFGDTSAVLIQNCKGHVYGIDPIVPDSMNDALIGSVENIKQLEKHHANFTFIHDYSYNVVKTWDKEIDYIFIDGDHNYEAVKTDFNDWYPHVKTGGIIALHDSACNRGGPMYWPGPSQLADELIQDKIRLEYIETVHTMTVFKKL